MFFVGEIIRSKSDILTLSIIFMKNVEEQKSLPPKKYILQTVAVEQRNLLTIWL